MGMDDRVEMVRGRPMFGCHSEMEELRRTPTRLCDKHKLEDIACCEGCRMLPEKQS